MKKTALIKNSISSVVYSAINILQPLIFSIYASRILLPSGIGKVAYASTIVSYFIVIANVGIPSYGIKVLSKNKDKKELIDKNYTELFILNSISVLLVSICFAVWLIFLNQDFYNKLMYIALGIQIPFCAFNVDWLFRGVEDYTFISLRNCYVKIISILLLIMLVKNEDDIISYSIILSVSSSINFFLGFISAKKYARFSFNDLNLSYHIKPILFLAVSLIFSSAYSKIDITMLGLMKSDFTVGIYDNAHKIIQAIISVCIAVTAVFLPRISYLYENDRDEFLHLLDKGIKIIFLITIPAVVGIFLVADNIIPILYGNEFSLSARVLKVFAVLIFVKSFGDLVCYQLIISIDKEKIFAPVAGIAMIINLVLNYVLIPDYSEVGAAIASVISELFLNIFLFFYVTKYIELKIDSKFLVKILLSTLLMALTVNLIGNFTLNDMLNCILKIISGVIVYILMMIILNKDIVSKKYIH